MKIEKVVFYVGLAAASITVADKLIKGLDQLYRKVLTIPLSFTITVPSFVVGLSQKKIGAALLWALKRNKPNVAALQQGLNEIYQTNIKIDGVYGPDTLSGLTHAITQDKNTLAVLKNIGFDAVTEQNKSVII